MPWSRRLASAAVATLTAAVLLLSASTALAHEERPVAFPDGSGSVPVFRTQGPELLVCKTDRADFERRVAVFPADLKARNLELFERCAAKGYRHLQEAVDQVRGPGSIIRILPGTYLEEPSLAEPAEACRRLQARWSDLGYQILSFEQQRQCPHNQNLVAIMGVRDLQIEGTGAAPQDVIIDARYRKLNAIRADTSDGVYFRNFTAQRTTFNSLYVLATDGFVIDRVLTRWNDEYGFLTFASDHGLYKDCESYGNGDSGIYPGSASDLNDDRGHDVRRYAIEITGCKSHHNMTGYSGTAGDSVWAHDNEFYENMSGVAMDSLFPGHPGLPQNHAKFERNDIRDNNADYVKYIRDGTCAKPPAERGYEQGVVCPQIGTAPGTGILTAGGNYNVFSGNWIHGHERAAFQLFGAPAFLRGEEDLAKMFDTSHHNAYIGNRLGVSPSGERRPNEADLWWDGQGTANCWQADAVTTSPATVPVCGSRPGELAGPATGRVLGEPVKLAKLMVCAEYNAREARVPAGCDWFGATGLGRVDVQVTLGLSVFLGLVTGLLWWRRLRGSVLGTLGAVAVLAGLALDVPAVAYDHTVLPAVALVLTGAGWVAAGLALRRSRAAFGWTTVAVGALALVDAFDKAVLMLPLLPLGPGWIRGLVSVVWVLWAVVVLAHREPTRTAEAPA
ncbi:right-handed parallel beta-helix repeat-containing protein [Spongiactinospora sp. TRM90649]|uniref:right-handed parallel beta-helix repeat-containing protein n=1 Tax=Spongiactinospora sp. TRM90649 TaxID=3031114 RepID=UPI0023F7F0B3|nr:right-handed parallel beta-helix repeat-containing protein [Spongiactinospora sp. TRM90649]MDF5755772.1 right-handed parallel beta-helix repeat-containing protein [Spongiactinospora sp. TRM90649]